MEPLTKPGSPWIAKQTVPEDSVSLKCRKLNRQTLQSQLSTALNRAAENWSSMKHAPEKIVPAEISAEMVTAADSAEISAETVKTVGSADVSKINLQRFSVTEEGLLQNSIFAIALIFFVNVPNFVAGINKKFKITIKSLIFTFP
jgi:hypothetical protein